MVEGTLFNLNVGATAHPCLEMFTVENQLDLVNGRPTEMNSLLGSHLSSPLPLLISVRLSSSLDTTRASREAPEASILTPNSAANGGGGGSGAPTTRDHKTLHIEDENPRHLHPFAQPSFPSTRGSATVTSSSIGPQQTRETPSSNTEAVSESTAMELNSLTYPNSQVDLKSKFLLTSLPCCIKVPWIREKSGEDNGWRCFFNAFKLLLSEKSKICIEEI